MSIQQRIATKAIIAKEGKVLVLREANTYVEGTNHGKYHFPGGRLEAGEPFEDGLRREVREETGLKIVIHEPIFVGEWFPEIKGVKNQIVAIFFVCEAISAEIRLSSEHDDYQWVHLDNMNKYDVMSPDNKVIEKYFGKTR